ncbi:MAG: NADH dehydrogenase ubiquinone Fe-S protein 4, partial [Rhodospirillales bacterium]
MTEVRIYKPSKSAMQSGRINTRQWVLEYEPGSRKKTDPLM